MSRRGPGGPRGNAGPPGPEDPFGSDDPMDSYDEPWRLRDHIGVISGLLLGLIALGILLLISAAGDPGAFAILVVVVIGIALIFFGGQLHKGRRR